MCKRDMDGYGTLQLYEPLHCGLYSSMSLNAIHAWHALTCTVFSLLGLLPLPHSESLRSFGSGTAYHCPLPLSLYFLILLLLVVFTIIELTILYSSLSGWRDSLGCGRLKGH